MFVVLTKGQRQMMGFRTVHETVLHEALHADMLDLSKTKVRMTAPYIAWRHARELLMEHNFGPRGGKAKHATYRSMNALRAITVATTAIERHPALRNAAVIGTERSVEIPAWELAQPDLADRRYSPYPILGAKFVILTPVSQQAHDGTRLTVWEPRQPPLPMFGASGLQRLTQESVHLSLLR